MWIEDDKLKATLEGIDDHPVLFGLLCLVRFILILRSWQAKIRGRHSISCGDFNDMDVQFAIKVYIVKRKSENVSIAVGDAALKDNAAIERTAKGVNVSDEADFLENVVDLNEAVDTNGKVPESFVGSFRNTETSDC